MRVTPKHSNIVLDGGRDPPIGWGIRGRGSFAPNSLYALHSNNTFYDVVRPTSSARALLARANVWRTDDVMPTHAAAQAALVLTSGERMTVSTSKQRSC
jgi:hypothetical protein